MGFTDVFPSRSFDLVRGSTELLRLRVLTGRLRKPGIDVRRVGMIAPVLPFAVTALELPIEFVHQYVDDVIRIFAIRRSHQIRAADLDLAGGGVVTFGTQSLVTLQTNVDADNVVIVSQQHGEFFMKNVLHRFREFEVHRLHAQPVGKFGIRFWFHLPVDPALPRSLRARLRTPKCFSHFFHKTEFQRVVDFWMRATRGRCSRKLLIYRPLRVRAET